MRRMNIGGLLVLVPLIGFYIPELFAQTAVITPQDTERETLRGLKGVHVIIEKLRDNIIQVGLTQGILKTDVELKLRKAGIRVLGAAERLILPGAPVLYVNINAMVLKSPREFIYSAVLEFRQDVILSRNRSIKTLGTTWTTGFIGITPDLRGVREAVSDQVDHFMNDYLAVNPK